MGRPSASGAGRLASPVGPALSVLPAADGPDTSSDLGPELVQLQNLARGQELLKAGLLLTSELCLLDAQSHEALEKRPGCRVIAGAGVDQLLGLLASLTLLPRELATSPFELPGDGGQSFRFGLGEIQALLGDLADTRPDPLLEPGPIRTRSVTGPSRW